MGKLVAAIIKKKWVTLLGRSRSWGGDRSRDREGVGESARRGGVM